MLEIYCMVTIMGVPVQNVSEINKRSRLTKGIFSQRKASFT